MLSFDVSVPEFGEVVAAAGNSPMVGDGKSVAVTLSAEEVPVVAFLLPAEEALELSQRIWSAARKADPENTTLIATLSRRMAGNA